MLSPFIENQKNQ